ncbi:MAG: DUF3307 domain-containing protein [Cyanobacteria bacterium J06638_7]
MASPSVILGAGVQVFLLLAMGHFLADFGLQSDRMAQEKCRGKDHTLPWQWWLASHAAIHALVVSVITGVAWLGLAEWLVHMLIDDGKCRHRYSLGFDQLLHLICKVLWVVVMLANGWVGLFGLVRLS